MLSTEVSTPLKPSNTGIERERWTFSRAALAATQPLARASLRTQPASEHNLTSVSKSKQCRYCYSLKPSQDKCKSSNREMKRQCCLASGRIRLTSLTTLSDDLAS